MQTLGSWDSVTSCLISSKEEPRHRPLELVTGSHTWRLLQRNQSIYVEHYEGGLLLTASPVEPCSPKLMMLDNNRPLIEPLTGCASRRICIIVVDHLLSLHHHMFSESPILPSSTPKHTRRKVRRYRRTDPISVVFNLPF